ncbi:MAG: hypothetical protein GXO50_06490 [Chlorobi bacterium]|nr:hypothetical protein [Chlorobiota bacterium]
MNNKNKIRSVLKTTLMIFIITVFTYAVMAVITHFSLNYKLPDYNFTDSLMSVFNFNTDIFKFFSGFILINIFWITIAVSINLLLKQIRRKT